MQKLANISTFENLQNQAHRDMGLVSDMAVFNRLALFVKRQVSVPPELIQRFVEDMPRGDASTDTEKLLVASYQLVRAFNQGDALNSVDNYDEKKDQDLVKSMEKWFRDAYYDDQRDETGFYDSPYMEDYDFYQLADDYYSYTGADNDFTVNRMINNDLDKYAHMLVEADPKLAAYVGSLRSAKTVEDYGRQLEELLKRVHYDLEGIS